MSSSVCKRYKERSMYKQTSYSLKASRERTELLQHRFPRLSSRGKRVRERERESRSWFETPKKIPLVAHWRLTAKRERNTRVSVGASCVVAVLLLSSAFVFLRYSVELLDIPSRSEISYRRVDHAFVESRDTNNTRAQNVFPTSWCNWLDCDSTWKNDSKFVFKGIEFESLSRVYCEI